MLTVKFNRRHARISSSVTSWIRLMTIAKLLDINMISPASQNLFALLTFSSSQFSRGFNVRDYSSIFEVKTKIMQTQGIFDISKRKKQCDPMISLSVYTLSYIVCMHLMVQVTWYDIHSSDIFDEIRITVEWDGTPERIKPVIFFVVVC